MTNLVRFQRGYQAASRAFSTMDEMLDTLINRTGKVGPVAMRITQSMLTARCPGRPAALGHRRWPRPRSRSPAASASPSRPTTPIGTHDARALPRRARRPAQYRDNAASATSWVSATDSALQQVSDITQRVRELAVSGRQRHHGRRRPQGDRRRDRPAHQRRQGRAERQGRRRLRLLGHGHHDRRSTRRRRPPDDTSHDDGKPGRRGRSGRASRSASTRRAATFEGLLRDDALARRRHFAERHRRPTSHAVSSTDLQATSTPRPTRCRGRPPRSAPRRTASTPRTRASPMRRPRSRTCCPASRTRTTRRRSPTSPPSRPATRPRCRSTAAVIQPSLLDYLTP